MVKQTSRLIYKPDSQSTEEYLMFVEPAEYKKYSEDKSIPIVQVVDSYDVFFSNQGNQGKLGKASKQQLENVFKSTNQTDIAEFMLKNGVLQQGEAIEEKYAKANKNPARGSGNTNVPGGY